ncbi:hybrid sensor histidine kinase/response regulator [Limnobacter parvus]|uniref:Response regulator n=1 Tax=Limnobacter parvus TaxID=2939690 RepID=A0ABT1XJK2_9BURK|nr:ATP-binding protein [Limnobacter parvus]MCR2746447.1 response regulator [Limnobacter parvus]
MSDSKGLPPSLLDISNFSDGGLKVLVVEDNDSDFELMCYRLKQGGLNYTATRVDRIEDLRKCLEHEEWQVVISDHNLPGFGSEEALRVVRDSGLDIPFIIVSGSIGEHVAVEAMRAGADDYLMKDKMARLVPAIERSLRAANERRNLVSAEQAQRESERRFAAIAENIPGIIFQMHSGPAMTKPTVPFVSEGVVRLFGVPSRLFLENPHYFFEQFEAEDAANLYELLTEPQRPGVPVSWEGRIKNYGKKESRWVYMNAVAKPRGNVFVWDGVLLDISDRKEAEDRLQRTKTELRLVTTEFEKRREQERGAIAREIHDDMGGSLTKLKADVAWLNKNLPQDIAVQEKLDDMLELIEHLLASSQRIAKDLRPGILDYGLIPALEWQMNDFQKRTQIEGMFQCNAEELDLNPEQSTALFRILQEALTNIVKHAHATRVDVELFITENELSLEIRDNGRGIENTDKLKETSFGLRGMQERVAAFDGWVDVSGSLGSGTTVMVSIPRCTQTGEAGDD